MDDTPTREGIIFVMAWLVFSMAIVAIVNISGAARDEFITAGIPYAMFCCMGASLFIQIICHEAANPYRTPGDTAAQDYDLFEGKIIVSHALITILLFALLLAAYIFGMNSIWSFAIIPLVLFFGTAFALIMLTGVNERKVKQMKQKEDLKQDNHKLD